MYLPVLLDFSFSSMISDALTIITSIFTFIQGNLLLIGIIGVPLAIGFIFSLVNYIRSR